MKRNRVFLAAAFWIYSIAHSFCLAPQASENASGTVNEADLRKILASTSSQVNNFYKAESFPVLVPSADDCKFKFETDPASHETVGRFIPEQGALVAAEILASSSRFIKFRNDAAANAYENSPQFGFQPPAKWPEAHAIEVARKFANLFVEPWGACLGKPVANYGWDGHSFDRQTDKPLWIAGRWTVDWRQQTPTGIPYQNGHMRVMLSEAYGPYAVYLNFPAEYQDEHIVPLAQAKALIEARKGLAQILSWPPAKAALGTVQVPDKPSPSIELMVVQPNNMTEQKSMLDAMLANQRKARLAWVVTYKISPSSGDGSGYVSVYIDAKDGSFLGGYF